MKNSRPKPAPDKPRGVTGKHARWRPKVRQPRSFVMTKTGHVMLDHHLKRTGLSRGDFIESLVREFGERIKVEPPRRVD